MQPPMTLTLLAVVKQLLSKLAFTGAVLLPLPQHWLVSPCIRSPHGQ